MQLKTSCLECLIKLTNTYNMASIIATSINLNAIPKDKIIIGKKGKYLPITVTINDEIDQFGNQGPVTVQQSKEERGAKIGKVYLGNCKVVWTNGDNVSVVPRQDQPAAAPPASTAPADLTVSLKIKSNNVQVTIGNVD